MLVFATQPKRVTPPKWARKAVFFRDRGMCAICGTDLSGLVSLSPIENFDHMVPLARGGLNDVTNLQLLCQPCNLRKRDGTATTSRTYEAWYDMED
ncbi:HNH endonuclease [Leptolyngbya sp. FACHB-541]|nr:HNH endonuclease [Leptolyngbya sp. FACHB-541]